MLRGGVVLVEPHPRSPWTRTLFVGAFAGLGAYAVLWLTVAWAFEQDPLLLRVRDLYPFASGAALFASGGLVAGALASAGRRRAVAGVFAGLAVGYALATAHVLTPYALPFRIPAILLVGGGAGLGGAFGLALDFLRTPRLPSPARAPGPGAKLPP